MKSFFQGARVVSKPYVVSVGLSVKSYTGTAMGLANAEVNPHHASITSSLALLFLFQSVQGCLDFILSFLEFWKFPWL